MGRKTVVKTLRYCQQCKRNTFWLYNRIIRHSRCHSCGGSFSRPVDEKEILLREIEKYRHAYKDKLLDILKKYRAGKKKELQKIPKQNKDDMLRRYSLGAHINAVDNIRSMIINTRVTEKDVAGRDDGNE